MATTAIISEDSPDHAVRGLSATPVPISQKKKLKLRVVKRLAHHVRWGTDFRARWSDFILTHFKE